MGIPTIVILSIAVINRFKNKRIFVSLLGNIMLICQKLIYILGLYFTISLAFLITNFFKVIL